MDLDIFQSEKGDCLLLSGSGGGTVLCDGGMASSMRRHLRNRLGQLHEDGKEIDAVYVSHIDQDHISGVLQLLEDLLDWKVYEYHASRPGGTEVSQPGFPRPPEIRGIWHNSFRDLITENRGRIEDLLAATAPVLYATGVEEAVHTAHEMQNIATSIPEALKVSRLIKPDLLGIPLNQPPGRPGPGELMLIEDPNHPFLIGSLSFQLIGPSRAQLRELRRGWNNWLRTNAGRMGTRRVREEMRRRVEEFSTGNSGGSPFEMRDWNDIPDFDGVTIPNTASLMFLVEDRGKTLLLTGDSHHDLVLDGLRETGRLVDGEYLHVDVLKVPHHGSENNVDRNFCRRISADHYVFCGNGSHGNPEKSVLEMYFESRVGSQARRALAPEADGREFKFWFSTTSELQTNSSARESFRETEATVDRLIQLSGGRMSAEFNTRDWIRLSV